MEGQWPLSNRRPRTQAQWLHAYCPERVSQPRCREGSPSRAQLIPWVEDMRWKSGESKWSGFYRAKGQREDWCTEKEPQGSAKGHPWVFRRVVISSGMCRHHAQLTTETPKQTGGTVSTITKGEEQCLLPTRRYKTSSINSISLDRALRIVLTRW